MKNLVRFLIAFVIILIGAYIKPVFFPEPLDKSAKKIVPTVLHKSVPYVEVEASGFAKYINENVSSLQEEYGDPIEILPTAVDYDWWIYGENKENYFQVAVKDQKVLSVLSLGEALDTGPFTSGMKLTDISDITTIYSNFFFQYQEIDYDIELTEEDMNYRPLLAFENGSFAVLHFNQQNGKLIGIRYVNKEILLQLMPYQLNEGDPLSLKISDTVDWESVNHSNSQQMVKILNILREKEKKSPYELSLGLQNEVAQKLGPLDVYPDQFIYDKRLLMEWEQQEIDPRYAQPSFLNTETLEKLFSTSTRSGKDLHAIGMRPAYDSSWISVYLYSDFAHQYLLSYKKDHYIGVGFSKNSMLLLLGDELPKESEESKEGESS